MRRELISYSVLIAFLAGDLHAGDFSRSIINRDGQRGIVHLHSAHTMGGGKIAFGLWGDGTLDQTYSKCFTTQSDSGTAAVSRDPAISSFNTAPFLGVGLTDFFDVSISLPVAVDLVGNHADAGIGDMRIVSKLSAHSTDSARLFDLGAVGAVSIATGSDKAGYFPRHSYYFNKDSLALDTPKYVPTAYFSSKKSDFEVHVVMSLDFNALKRPIPLAIHTDCGMHFSAYRDNDDAVLLSGAIEWHPVRSVGFFTEFNSEMRLHNVTHGFNMGLDPLHISPGMTIAASNGFLLTVGGEFSLASSGVNYLYRKRKGDALQHIRTGIEPKWRLFAQVGWGGALIERDRDGDGITDTYDDCRFVKEDVDGYRDDDGCPEFDNDEDGVTDSLDKCPGKAEDKDGFQDDDGCPEFDNDEDGIADSLDMCPTVGEDHDGFQNRDGCPDYDNDADMVPDSADRCPNIPEDIDGTQDGDGCPDIDNDLDGIPDSLDACPNQAGSPRDSGCPGSDRGARGKAKEIKRGRVILRDVLFGSGTAMIDPSSFSFLDKVVLSLAEWPEVRIEIQGHTDEAGTEMERMELSKKRAEAVRDYCIGKGIEAHRLSSTGRGDGDPIADNSVAQGRSLNNRIEIRRTDP